MYDLNHLNITTFKNVFAYALKSFLIHTHTFINIYIYIYIVSNLSKAIKVRINIKKSNTHDT